MKKTYAGLIGWLVGFTAVLLGAALLPVEDPAVTMRLLCVLCAAGMAVLSLVILRTGCVYWYNGTSFEEAEAAGPARRYAFALAHFKRFGGFALGLAGFAVLAQALGLPAWADCAVLVAGLSAAAFSTLPLRL